MAITLLYDLKAVPFSWMQIEKGLINTPQYQQFRNDLEQFITIDLIGSDFEMFKNCPLKLSIIFCIPLTKSWKKETKRARAGKRAMVKPDLTNLEKAVEDCLTGRIFEDDCLVCVKETKKVWTKYPKIWIKVEELN